MRKYIKPYVALFLTLSLISGTGSFSVNAAVAKPSLSNNQLMNKESKGSFDFFWKEANTEPSSAAYGLIRDRAKNDNNTNTTDSNNVCSVASVGFGLTGLVIGADKGFITRKQAHDRALGTINTLLNNADQVNGFFYHFLDMNTAKRVGTCEVSIIDTGIALNGAITAGEYFGGDVKIKAQQLYDRVNWPWYVDKSNNQFYMGYSPENGFVGHWDVYAEQLQLYVLGAGSSTHPIDPNMMYSFIRHVGSYGNSPEFINSWFGSLFTHQFSYAWIDFNNKVDSQGVNWWENSVIASKSSRQYAIDQGSTYKTLGPNAWGLTACDGPKGYSGLYGSNPSGFDNDQVKNDGTLAPAGALGSIVFTPKESLSALRNYYENFPSLWGKYGLKDSYNLDLHDAYPSEYAVNTEWYDTDVIGIDKGITLLMIENYRNGTVWNNYMRNKNVKSGIEKIGLSDINIKTSKVSGF